MLKVPRSCSRSRRVSIPADRRSFKTWKRWPRSGWDGWRISAHPKCDLCSSAVRADRRDAQRPSFPRLSGLRNVNPADQRNPLAAAAKLLFDLAQEPRFAMFSNLVDVHLIHTRCTLIGLHPLPGLLQDVLPTDLIVEKREPPCRLLLGHSV